MTSSNVNIGQCRGNGRKVEVKEGEAIPVTGHGGP
jgi:hypothetical protein